jgi:amicyanin
MKITLIRVLVVVILLLGIILTGCAQQSKPSTTGQTGQTQQTPATETSGQQNQTGQTQTGEQTNQTQPQQNQTNQSTNQQQNQTPPPAAKTYDVTIQGFVFNPSELNIKTGDTVTWTNKDSAPHTVVSDSGSELDSPSLSQGQTFSHTFNQAGTFNYHCGLHLSMKAKVVVS